jgi:hypothetical protein
MPIPVQPKADQPRVSTQALDKDQPKLEYRVQGIKSMAKPAARPDKRATRGY